MEPKCFGLVPLVVIFLAFVNSSQGRLEFSSVDYDVVVTSYLKEHYQASPFSDLTLGLRILPINSNSTQDPFIANPSFFSSSSSSSSSPFSSSSSSSACWIQYALFYNLTASSQPSSYITVAGWNWAPFTFFSTSTNSSSGVVYSSSLLGLDCSSIQINTNETVNPRQTNSQSGWVDVIIEGIATPIIVSPSFACGQEEGGTNDNGAYSSTSTSSDIVVQRVFRVYNDQPFVKLFGSIQASPSTPSRAWTITQSELLRLNVPTDATSVFGGGAASVFNVAQWNGYYTCANPTNIVAFAPLVTLLLQGRAPYELRMGSVASYAAPYLVSEGWFAVAAPNPELSTIYNSGQYPEFPVIGLVSMIAFNGKSRLQMQFPSGDASVFYSTIDNLNHPFPVPEWNQTSFDCPGSYIGIFTTTQNPTSMEGNTLMNGVVQMDDAGYAIQQFAEEYVYPPLPDDNYPYVQYDSWNYGLGINQENQYEAMMVAVKLGLEAFILDLGWATQIGEWVPDVTKFPGGLSNLSSTAHALGMRFGLHIPLTQMAAAATFAQEHPWALVNLLGQDYFGASPLCLGNSLTRNFLVDSIVSLIDLYNVDYFVQDGEDMVKNCELPGHEHDPQDSNYVNSELGLDRVWQQVLEKRPGIVLENCEDGGSMVTYKMAEIYHTSLSIDSVGTYMTRMGIYGHSFGFSNRFNVRYFEVTNLNNYTIRSQLFGGPLILQQAITNYTSEQIELVGANIQLYKQLRPRIRVGKVLHIAAPVVALSQEDGFGWDAIGSVDGQNGTWAIVFIFRAYFGEDSFTFHLRDLQPSSQYEVKFEDHPGNNTVMTGQDLTSLGITLSLPMNTAEIIQIDLL